MLYDLIKSNQSALFRRENNLFMSSSITAVYYVKTYLVILFYKAYVRS